MKTKVKICGITNLDDALVAVESGADLLGFVFYKKSKRFIRVDKAKEIIKKLPKTILKVGVFVNEDIKKVKEIVKLLKLDFVQLHGDEDEVYLKKLKGARIIKAIRVKNKTSLSGLEGLNCDLFLFDTFKNESFGGTGKSFDWSLAKEIKLIKKPYVISGGLTTQSVDKAVKTFIPFAVDVSSGVEKSPGNKNATLMKEFIANAKR